MADTKISELASATTLTEADVLVGVNSGTTKKFTLQRIRELFQKTFDGLYALSEHTHSTLSNGAYTVTIPSTIKRNDSFVLQSEKTASNISYDHASSKMDAENVQQAVDELNSKMAKLPTTAAGISYDNSGTGYTAKTTQAAIDEAAQKIKNVTDSRGKANGYAGLGSNGVVPTAQLPVFISGVSVSVKNMTISITATKSKS